MTKPDYYIPDSTTDVHTPQKATTSAFCILDTLFYLFIKALQHKCWRSDTSRSIHHLKSLYYDWNQKALIMAMP